MNCVRAEAETLRLGWQRPQRCRLLAGVRDLAAVPNIHSFTIQIAVRCGRGVLKRLARRRGCANSNPSSQITYPQHDDDNDNDNDNNDNNQP